MAAEHSFDSFYGSTRRAVLRQTFALTGDLPATRAALRDSYARAWQHWGRVSRLEDPLAWVRARAWRLAEDRRGAPHEHGHPVLAALATLSPVQRRMLVLVGVSGLDPASAAREAGVTAGQGPAALGAAVERFAGELSVRVGEVPGRLAALDALLRDEPLWRATEVRRAGTRRHRRHLSLLVAAALTAVALVAGALGWAPASGPAQALRALGTPAHQPTRADGPRLPAPEDLLDAGQVSRLGGPGRWVIAGATSAGAACRQRDLADPAAQAAMARSFHDPRTSRRSAVQTVEVSRSGAEARRAYDTTVGWYAGCPTAGLQVLHAYRVQHLGDQAQVLTLRVHGRPVTTLSVAVARTGAVTTSVTASTTSSTAGTAARAAPRVGQVVGALAVAVRNLCDDDLVGRCVGAPTYRAVPPPPAGHGEERGVMAVVDLPPVGRVAAPWAGSRPTDTRAGPSATSCDRADFARAGATHRRTRTFLVPDAGLPARFGLSETYGRFRSSTAAARFLTGVRDSVRGCEKRDLSVDVGAERRRGGPAARLELSQWLVTTTVSEQDEVAVRVGFVRVGRSVAQLTFAPYQDADLSASAFASLLARAGDRLRELG